VEEKVVQAVVGPTPLPKVPIPKHLLQGGAKNMRTKNTTKPVGGKGGKKKFREPGWRNINAGHVVDYGMKAWQLAKHLATLINVEDKKFDVDGTAGTLITLTPTIVNLTNIAQGNDYFNRAGDSILGQAIEFRAYLTSNAARMGHTVRLLIVVDRENHGVDPVIGDVLQGMSLPSVAPINAVSANRFEILYDELCLLQSPSTGLASSGTNTTYISHRMALPTLCRKWNKHIKYTGSTGVDASNWENAIFLMAVGEDASNGPTLTYSWRLHFTDN
jgi:hypothetical protein